jgi:hypothetical protein
MIGGARSRNWTGPNYYKVTAEFSEALDRWLSTNWSGIVRRCGHCLQPNDGTPMARPHTAVLMRPQTPAGQSVRISPVPTTWQLWSMGNPVKVLD